jgi:hypothetical protein
VHRPSVGDLEEARALRVIERTLERDELADLVAPALARLAVGAVGRVDLAVVERDGHRPERPAVALGVEAHRHRRAGAEARQQEVGHQAGAGCRRRGRA